MFTDAAHKEGHQMGEIPSILAIEPDPGRANALTRLVHEYVDANVVVSASADVAVAVMMKRMPELILLSAFTPPGDERSLVAFLREANHGGVPVLIVSPGLEPRAERAEPSSGLRSLLGRRRPVARELARDAFAARMRGALERSREYSIECDALRLTSERSVCIPRARRWPAQDVSWLGVRLSSGFVGHLVNISNSGLLVDSDSALMPGNAVTFELCNPNGERTELWRPDTELIVLAQIVRSEVSKVGPDRLRYRVAAKFSRDLELLSERPIDQGESTDPRDLDAPVMTAASPDDVAPRTAGDGLQDLARALERLQSTVSRICPPTGREQIRPRIH
ncbi:MAG: hypothetical protein ACRD3C_23385 [Vicinamibacterales bacterium]